tara:strand:- start:267 stop:524 length:258 start_codon:yes stop_codon:yes gene_type:complete
MVAYHPQQDSVERCSHALSNGTKQYPNYPLLEAFLSLIGQKGICITDVSPKALKKESKVKTKKRKPTYPSSSNGYGSGTNNIFKN